MAFCYCQMFFVLRWQWIKLGYQVNSIQGWGLSSWSFVVQSWLLMWVWTSRWFWIYFKDWQFSLSIQTLTFGCWSLFHIPIFQYKPFMNALNTWKVKLLYIGFQVILAWFFWTHVFCVHLFNKENIFHWFRRSGYLILCLGKSFLLQRKRDAKRILPYLCSLLSPMLRHILWKFLLG